MDNLESRVALECKEGEWSARGSSLSQLIQYLEKPTLDAAIPLIGFVPHKIFSSKLQNILLTSCLSALSPLLPCFALLVNANSPLLFGRNSVCVRVCACVGVFPEEHFDLSQPPDVGSPPHEGTVWLASPSSTPRSVGRES